MNTQFVLRSIALAAAVAIAACASAPHDHAAMPSEPGAASPTTAVPTATARLMNPGGQPAGTVTFASTPNGVEVVVVAEGLKPGVHGLHIHANGACATGPDGATGQLVDFGAAGGHFDPGGSHNHGRPGDDKALSHAGELPALEAGVNNRASLRYVNANVSLDRMPTSVMGRTVVVHADPDDYVSDPAGNSGARVLCGVVEANAPTMVKGRATLEGNNVFPEGIAVDPRSGDAFVGSSATGDLYRLKPGATRAELFQAGGAVGRQGAFGMKFDNLGRLWVAGGPNGTLAAVDPTDASTLVVLKAPTDAPSFLNDLVITRDGTAYITDSFRPVIYRMRTAPGAAAVLEPWLNLASSPIRYQPNQINLNGIVASGDGRYLLTVQLITGQLWRIDTQSQSVTRVRVEGGDLKDGDGLVLAGADDLYVMRNASHEVARVRLSPDWTSGRIAQRINDPRLHYPSTAAMSAAGLMVVNAQLDKQKAPPALLPFDVVTLELSR